MDVAADVYPRLTFEFLVTLTRHESSKGRYITFNALNMVYSMSYLDVAGAFNWVLRNNEYVVPSEADIMSFWLAITGNRVYRGSGNKISHVYHPAMWYIFRFLSMTIFCHGEPGGVTKPELAAMRSFLVYDQGTPDWVDIFVERCLAVRNADRGKIGMGGMVTLLVMFLGIEIPDNVPALVHNTTIF
jgi:ATHILA ORF-1 family protein